MKPKKRWYLLNDGNFGYSIEHSEEASEIGMSDRGGWSDFGTYREAKKEMMEKLRSDLAEARDRLNEGRKLTKKQAIKGIG